MGKYGKHMTPWAFSFYHSSCINKVDVCMYICINSVKIWWGFVKKREGSRACRNFTFLNTIRHSVHCKRKTGFSIRAQVATIIIICSLLDFIKCYNWGAKSLWGYHNNSYQNHHLAHKIVKRRKIICLEKKKRVLRVANGFCMTRDGPKICRATCDWTQIVCITWDQTSQGEAWFAIWKASDAWFTRLTN